VAWLFVWLVGCLVVGYHLLLRCFELYGIIFINVYVVITVTMLWLSLAVNRFWVLWDI
jgi:hypothetical protein